MALRPPHQPLFADDIGTQVTLLSPDVQTRLSAPSLTPVLIKEEDLDPAISQAINKLTEWVEPPPPAMSALPPHLAVPAPRWARPAWLWGLAGGLFLSLAGNVLCAVALRSAQLQLRLRPGCPEAVSGLSAAVTQRAGGESAAESRSVSPCVRDSTQTITGAERDRLLLSALREHESGRRAESLQLFKRYVSEACDAATQQAVAILERELAPPKKELGKSP